MEVHTEVAEDDTVVGVEDDDDEVVVVVEDKVVLMMEEARAMCTKENSARRMSVKQCQCKHKQKKSDHRKTKL